VKHKSQLHENINKKGGEILLHSGFNSYLESVAMKSLLEKLEVSNVKTMLEAIKHFTQKEAEKRDKILLSYFGEGGINRIVVSICERLLSSPKLKNDAQILDAGAGSGLFTTRIARNLHKNLPKASFYAMDITPAMLKMLAKKTSNIVPFLGVAENIAQSVRVASKYLNIPAKFDAIYSTLMLHHCLNLEKVFQSMKGVLKTHGKAVIIDLKEHSFTEFREEMGDVHLGFKVKHIEKGAKKFFKKVSIEKMPGICCSSSGRNAELFIAYMIK
jgi:ubiquinone/menaquinone biosynthesis C-methylase UbiE